ncbi:unnamed protein product, partial [Fusarium graminearum]
MHFIKTVVLGMSIAAVNAAALPAGEPDAVNCKVSGEGCEVHGASYGDTLRRILKKRATTTAKKPTTTAKAASTTKPTSSTKPVTTSKAAS